MEKVIEQAFVAWHREDIPSEALVGIGEILPFSLLEELVEHVAVMDEEYVPDVD